MKPIRLAVRGLIIDQEEILVFKHKEEFDYYSFPGGGVEYGETLETALMRELKEETDIAAIIGKQRFIHELIIKDQAQAYHLIEFFYFVENGADFREIKRAKASHGFEVFDMKWVPITTKEKILPKFILPNINKSTQATASEFFTSIS
jgi:8-oxo-dGTP diphosphatase